MNLISSSNQDLKPGNLKIGGGLCSWRVWRVLKSRVPTLKDTARQRASSDTAWQQQFEKHQGHMGGRVIYSSQSLH